MDSQIDDSQILPLSLKHNFWTWSAQGQVQPIPVTRAEGVHFWDASGKRYLDLNSMVMCCNIGHGDRRVIDAIIRQANELVFAGPGMATRPRAELGRLLAEITPDGLQRFLYTLGGADANEHAIKLARAHTGRQKILARYRSYHGATAGAMAATGDPRRAASEPGVMPGIVHFLDPYGYRSAFHPAARGAEPQTIGEDYLRHLEEVITLEGPATIAAVLLETVTGTNGVIVPPPGYLRGVRELCDRHGILLICDEVMSGFGRTGKWFAVDHWGVAPDLMTMAKGLTSGYAPLGAVAMRQEIADTFRERAYPGGLTYNAHPLSMAAAIANIRVMQEDGLIERAERMGRVLARLLGDLGEAHRSVGEVRTLGLFAAIELVRDRGTREPLAPFGSSSPVMEAVRRRLLDDGVFLYTHWHTLLVIPPLIITEEQLEEGVAHISQALTLADEAASA